MLKITQGDTVVFNLKAVNAGVAVDLTGAVFTTTIRGPSGVIRSFPNSQHTAAPDQTANRGKFTLQLSADDTSSLLVWPTLEVLTKIVIGGSTVYFHGPGILDVQASVPQIGTDNNCC